MDGWMDGWMDGPLRPLVSCSSAAWQDEEVLGTFLDLVGPLLAEASRKAGGGVPEDL